MKYYVVDSFTKTLFHGNPAGVCIVSSFPKEEVMQNIAAENRLSETAFVIALGEGNYRIRFFAPDGEVDLCGHASLGSAYIISQFIDPDRKQITLQANNDMLYVSIEDDGRITMEFPSWKAEEREVTDEMAEAVGFRPISAWSSRDLILVGEDEETVRNAVPDEEKIGKLEELGVLITARGKDADFVCRCFFPKLGIPEDPVCGSAECSLVPFWARQLSKNELVNQQLTKRGGTVYCEMRENSVAISGYVTIYAEADLKVEG
ncbi:MAG: PhzF family phenazine biosynthesis protein [Coriobacteriales bacterium]|jgi:PhzF family phenazine biosynthesis protein